MEIALNPPVLSIEFDNTTKFQEILSLEEKMNIFFKNKFYSDSVESYYIEFICVSPVFRPFNKPKRSKYYRNIILNNSFIQDKVNYFYKIFAVSMDLDFESFYQSNEKEGFNIIGNTLIKFLEPLKYPQAIGNFDKEGFNNDLRDFFTQIGCVI